MNYVFISPNYPDFFYKFCSALQRKGVSVFGVGDSAFIGAQLRNSLSQYFVVPNMTDFNAMCNVVEQIIHSNGEIGGIGSLNEFWLETESKLREKYGIKGAKLDLMQDYKYKSRMKKRFQQANVPTAPWINSSFKDEIIDFATQQGFPIFCKPDNGVGAEGTHKFCDMIQLTNFLECNEFCKYIFEPYVDGEIYSFDGLCDKDGDIVVSACHYFYTPIDRLKDNGQECVYRTITTVPDALLKAGTATVKAFELKSSFFHIEYFKLNSPLVGVAEIGEYVALEVNMRIAGGYTAEMLYFALGIDIYSLWATVICDEKPNIADYTFSPDKRMVVNVARKNGRIYKYSLSQLKDAFLQEFLLSAETTKDDNPFGNLEIISAFSDETQLDAFVKMAIEKV